MFDWWTESYVLVIEQAWRLSHAQRSRLQWRLSPGCAHPYQMSILLHQFWMLIETSALSLPRAPWCWCSLSDPCHHHKYFPYRSYPLCWENLNHGVKWYGFLLVSLSLSFRLRSLREKAYVGRTFQAQRFPPQWLHTGQLQSFSKTWRRSR